MLSTTPKAEEPSVKPIFFEDEVNDLQCSCAEKTKTIQDTLARVQSDWDAVRLIDILIPQLCFIDLLKLSNLQEVLTMPYSRELMPRISGREVVEKPHVYTIPGIDEYQLIDCLVQPNDAIDRALDASTALYHKIKIDHDLIQQNFPKMRQLASLYAQILQPTEAGSCALPKTSERIDSWAMPPLNELMTENNDAPNPEFFIKWIDAIYNKLLEGSGHKLRRDKGTFPKETPTQVPIPNMQNQAELPGKEFGLRI